MYHAIDSRLANSVISRRTPCYWHCYMTVYEYEIYRTALTLKVRRRHVSINTVQVDISRRSR